MQQLQRQARAGPSAGRASGGRHCRQPTARFVAAGLDGLWSTRKAIAQALRQLRFDTACAATTSWQGCVLGRSRATGQRVIVELSDERDAVGRRRIGQNKIPPIHDDGAATDAQVNDGSEEQQDLSFLNSATDRPVWDVVVNPDRVRYIRGADLVLYLDAHLRRAAHRREYYGAPPPTVDAQDGPDAASPSAAGADLSPSESVRTLTGKALAAKVRDVLRGEERSTTSAGRSGQEEGDKTSWAHEKAGKDGLLAVDGLLDELTRRLDVFVRPELAFAQRLGFRDSLDILDSFARSKSRREEDFSRERGSDETGGDHYEFSRERTSSKCASVLASLQAELLFAFPKLRGQEIASALWSAAKLQLGGAVLFMRHAALAVTSSPASSFDTSATSRSISAWSPRHAASLLHSCAACGYVNSTLFREAVQVLLAGNEANLQDLSNACWACAKVHFHDELLLRHAQKRFAGELRGYVLHSDRTGRASTEPQAHYFGSSAPAFNISALGEVAALCWAVAAAGKADDEFWTHERKKTHPVPAYVDEGFFSLAAEAVVAAVRQDTGHSSRHRQSLVVMLHAFASLGLYQEELARSVTRLPLDALSPQDVSNIAWALAYAPATFCDPKCERVVLLAGGDGNEGRDGSGAMRGGTGERRGHDQEGDLAHGGLPAFLERLAVLGTQLLFSASQLCNLVWALSVLSVTLQRGKGAESILFANHTRAYAEKLQGMWSASEGCLGEQDLVEIFCAATRFPALLQATSSHERALRYRAKAAFSRVRRETMAATFLEGRVRRGLQNEEQRTRGGKCRKTFCENYVIPNTHLDADFFLAEENLVIEVDGPSHFVWDLGRKIFRANGPTDCKKKLLEDRGHKVLNLAWLEIDEGWARSSGLDKKNVARASRARGF